MSIDNQAIVREFLPGQSKGPVANNDHVLYTELLDRTKRVGNNGVRIVKTFYHRDAEDFDRHLPQMYALCDALKVRAYTRLSPRSYRKVGAVFTKLVVEAALTDNFAGMKSLYTRACGIVTPERKLWMFDVDRISDDSEKFRQFLEKMGVLEGVVPSKRGMHFISQPFNITLIDGHVPESKLPDGISLHKDNATNLYIPDGAA